MRRILAILVAITAEASSTSVRATSAHQQCLEKIRQVEKEKGIEPGLLEAIAQIESKSCPYVVNACGRGYSFKSASEAAKFVKEKQTQGYRNISVGAMQLHVPSHRRNFKSLEEMCEIEHNVAYGAKLFKKLKRQCGTNEGAIKLYHSPNSHANEIYKTRVFGAWANIKLKRQIKSPD